MEKNQSLSKSIKELLLKESFYGYFLISLNKQWNDKIPTAGVSKHNIGFKLDISPDFWNGLNNLEKLGILKHELLHIAFFHLTMRDKYKDYKLFNIAADMEINQYIDKTWLPEGCIDINEFRKSIPHLKFKAGTDYYYKELLKEEESNGPGKSIIDQYKQDGDMHESWSNFEDLSEAEKKLLDSQTEYQLKQSAEQVSKAKGNIPGELSELISNLFIKSNPKFNWKAYLRRFAGGSQKVYTKKLRRKYNKRYPDNPGLKIKPKKHILVGVDTSGSVSSKELEDFFNEIHHIHKTGAQVTVIQCDTKIVDISPYKKGCEVNIKGRGGTSFTPVVDYYNKNIKDYSCLVYLTDGECCNPLNPPKGKTLWVISEESEINNDLPGSVIKLN